MTTAADLIERTRRTLMGTQREVIGKLDGAIADGTATTFTGEHLPSTLQAGSLIAIDLELAYVWSVNGTTVEIERGVLGTTAAAHADNTLVYVNPKFSAPAIFAAMNSELNQLCSPEGGLFGVASVDQTYNAAIVAYDLVGATNISQVLRVMFSVPGATKEWPELRGYRARGDQNLVAFPSGWAVHLMSTFPQSGQTLRIIYSTDFVPFTTLASTVASTLLPSTAEDLLVLGAAMQLTGVQEVRRNFIDSQGDTRRAQEVPPNASRAGYSALMLEYARRLKAETSKLQQLYPPRRNV